MCGGGGVARDVEGSILLLSRSMLACPPRKHTLALRDAPTCVCVVVCVRANVCVCVCG